jgi:hypothetical protein
MSARDLVTKYKALGYGGFVTADHMKAEDLRWFAPLPWRKKAERWLRGYRSAKAAAGDSFTVLLGMEIRFLDSKNDYLLFGIDEDFVLDNPNLHRYPNLKFFRPLAEKYDVLIVQAHPFRVGMTISDRKLLDGAEVLNGGPDHENNNEAAQHWAQLHGLIPTAGSDYHGRDLPHHCRKPEDFRYEHYGLRPEKPVQTAAQLAQILREGKYSLASI